MTGRVILRGTNYGIPNLLVAVLDAGDADPSSGPEEPEGLTRVAVGLTDSDGEISLQYGSESPAADRLARSTVLVTISAPSATDPRTGAPPVIDSRRFYRPAPREVFRIDIDADVLEVLEIPIPDAPREFEFQRTEDRPASEMEDEIRRESLKLIGERIKSRRSRELAVEEQFTTFMSALSGLTPDRRNSPSFVRPGSSVQEAAMDLIKRGLRDRVAAASTEGILLASEEVIKRYRNSGGGFAKDIPYIDLLESLKPKGTLRAPTLVRSPPLSVTCRSHWDVDPCIAVLDGSGEDVEEAPAPGEEAESTDSEVELSADVPTLVHHLVKHMSNPESTSIFKSGERASLKDLEDRVKGFDLHSGPADVPALHEFHHLQIAFESVWQELFDDGVVQDAKSLYSDLVEVGIDPNEYLIEPDELKIDISGKGGSKKKGTSSSDPPKSVVQQFEISPEQWHVLNSEHKKHLTALATQLNDELRALTKKKNEEGDGLGYSVPTYFKTGNEWWLAWKREQIRILRRKGQLVIAYADEKLRSGDKFDQLHPLLTALAKSLKEPYRFSIFAANRLERSVNFGVVATYRQRWVPESYQVGRLLKSVPLAPKESRKFAQKTSIKETRSEKEVENSLRIKKFETSETSRVESEIIQKASRKTNFQMGAEGGVKVGVVSAKGSTSMSQDAAAESQEVKKEFREAVFKAAEEYKLERNTEITLSVTEDVLLEESGEISNPNDEITVTYLFYELQRRYRVSEEIHMVRPCVLVAQEFPRPDEIDEDWIVAHDWILRRVILDDSFIPAMNYLASQVVGDEFSLQEQYKNLQQQRRIASDLTEELVVIRAQVGSRYAALQRSFESRAEALEAEERSGEVTPLPVGFLISDEDASPEAQQVREDAARDAYEREAKLEKELQSRLERETTALTSMSEAYTKTLSDHLNRKEQISRLRVHLKANIIYYMQAIWSHEPPDQRFFRLHDVRVPKLDGNLILNLEPDPDALPMLPSLQKPLKVTAHCDIPDILEFESLEEVADLDNLLGFKGNYMMFPLRQGNALTDFMTMPYLDPVAGLRDPDPLGNWTLSEFAEYVCCMRAELTDTEFDNIRPGLEEIYRALVNSPNTTEELLVIPTDCLFIEALPGVHPILEDYKLFHRVVDVKKAQADLRSAELENVRLLARLLAGEREDPTIEKKIVIEGEPSIVDGGDD